MKPSVEYSGRTGPCGFFFTLPHHPQLQQSLISPARLSQLLPGCATESSRISPRGRSGGGGVSGDGKWSVRLTLFRRQAAGIRDGTLRSTSRIGMSCPYCSSVDCCRSVRHDGQDFLHRLLGRFPWRCNVCRKRFYLRNRSRGRRPPHKTPTRNRRVGKGVFPNLSPFVSL